MEAVKEGIFLAVGAIGFCLAIMSFLIIVAEVEEAADSVYDRTKPSTQIGFVNAGEEMDYSRYENDLNVWSGNELMSYLMSDYHCIDVEIDGELILAEDININLIKELRLDKNMIFFKSCRYGTGGDLECIVFSGRS